MARKAAQADKTPLHYHLIGIGGTAMASLAGLLKTAGHEVTGSDENVYPPMSTELEGWASLQKRDIDRRIFRPKQDVVIVGERDLARNPELERCWSELR